MNALERRLDRLEKQQPASFAGEIWCCAGETEAQALLDDLRARNLPPPMLFIAGRTDDDGTLTWRRQGNTVDELFRAIEADCFVPTWGLSNAESETAVDPLFNQMSNEELLEVITGGGFTLVLYHDGQARLLDAKEAFSARPAAMSHEERLKLLS